jgi:hypothetical protein
MGLSLVACCCGVLLLLLLVQALLMLHRLRLVRTQDLRFAAFQSFYP